MVDEKSIEKRTSPDFFWQDLRSKAPLFVEKAVDFANEIGLNVEGLQIDHLGMRFANSEDVNFIRKSLSWFGNNISTAIVNGRLIAIYKLIGPIEAKGFKIPCIEVPYPAKEHKYPEDGWEHLEFVLPGKGTDIEKIFKEKFPNFKGDYGVDEPRVEGEQLPNPTVVIKHPINKMLTLKFHRHSIEEVVRSKV